MCVQKKNCEKIHWHIGAAGLLEEVALFSFFFFSYNKLHWETMLVLSVHQLSWCSAEWFLDIYFQSPLSVAAHLLGLAARCCALSQTSAQMTSSTSRDWRLSSRSTLFTLIAQGFLPLRLPLCQPDRCPVGADVSGVEVVGDGRIELNHCVINVCGWEVMGAQRARKHLQLARQSL